MNTQTVVMIVAIVAIIAFLALRLGGPRVTHIETRRDSDGDGNGNGD